MTPQNLLFIFSDEHNRDCSGCYGHRLVQTPHLDRLAAGGVQFSAAYTNCPICVPARASLATGRYVHEIGYWDNAFPYEGRVPGWGHRLIEAGHRVDSIGKLHYRSEADEDGFSNKIVPLNVVDGVGDLLGSIRDDSPPRQGMRRGVSEAGPGSSTYLDYDEEIAAHATAWLRDAGARRDDKPWLLFVGFVCPHPPYIAPPELYAQYPLDQIELPIQNLPDERPAHPALEEIRQTMQYDTPFSEEEIRRVTAAYYGACTHLDNQIGKVLRAVEDSRLVENTHIIYTSDHGESIGHRGLWGKFTMYEESVAVPLIMSGPDIPTGRTCDDIVSLVDCYPTFLDSLGVDLTDDERSLPGRSLLPIAQGQKSRRIGFSEYHAVASKSGWFMIRDGPFKYVYYVGHRPQLFDLNADPTESNDLAKSAEHQEILQKMEQQLRGLLDPEAVDARAKADQQQLIDQYGGRDAVLERGTFVNSPTPGETPRFVDGA
jgi:choline-sulfatase